MPPIVPPSSRTRMFFSWYGAFDRHEGDPGADDDRRRAEQVVADQVRHGVPAGDLLGMPCRPEEVVAVAPSGRESAEVEWDRETYDQLLAQSMRMSDVHVVLTSGNLTSSSRLSCAWVDRAISHAFGGLLPQVCVDVSGLRGVEGRATRPGTNVFDRRQELVRGKAEQVAFHDYGGESGASRLPLWCDAEIRRGRSVANRPEGSVCSPHRRRLLRPSNGVWSAREVKVLVSAAGLYTRDPLDPRSHSDSSRWDAVRRRHTLPPSGPMVLGRGLSLLSPPPTVFRRCSDEVCARVVEDVVRSADLHLVLLTEHTAECRWTAEAVAHAERWGVPQLGVRVHGLPDRRGEEARPGRAPLDGGVPVRDYVDDDGDANLAAWIAQAIARSLGERAR